MKVPVYLFTGFLESGKTTFIKEILKDEDFVTNENSLLILCEEGVEELEKAELEKAICETYNTDETKYLRISDIPMDMKIEAITDTCQLSGLSFDDYNDILNYFYDKYKNN